MTKRVCDRCHNEIPPIDFDNHPMQIDCTPYVGAGDEEREIYDLCTKCSELFRHFMQRWDVRGED